MSRNRLLAVIATVLLALVAFLLWARIEPAKAVNTGGAVPPTASAATPGHVGN